MAKPFTGWHMTGILCSFFLVVIAVNVVMARAAISTFGGTVVDNSYVASQQFNTWLAASRAQASAGWSAKLTLDKERHVLLSVAKLGGVPTNLVSEGVAHHPLGRAPEIALNFSRNPFGELQSRQSLPDGRWLIHAQVRADGQTAKFSGALE